MTDASGGDEAAAHPVERRARALAGVLLSRVTSERTHAGHMHALVSRLMPVVFVQTLAEDAQRTVAIFDASHENPELIWNARCARSCARRSSTSPTRRSPRSAATRARRTSSRRTLAVEYPQHAAEQCVGGIYIKQLLAQPAWQLRDPRSFLEALLGRWVAMVDADTSEHADEMSQALVVLLQANPALSPHVAAMGYLTKLLKAVPSPRADVQKAATQAVRILSESQEVVHSMRSLDCVAPLLAAMRATPQTCALILPALTNMAAAQEVVEKAHEAKLVPFVLGLLSGGLEQCDDPSAIKAHAVKLLKTLANDLRLGPTIVATLDEDAVWENYKSQEHDLFLAPDANAGLLTQSGVGAGRVGLLTQ